MRAGTTAEVMAVVKGDGYGHGMLPSARAALAGGATWLGVATLDEGLALRRAGFEVPVLAWLHSPGLALHEGVAAGIDLSASTLGLVGELVTAALEVDAGLVGHHSRGERRSLGLRAHVAAQFLGHASHPPKKSPVNLPFL